MASIPTSQLPEIDAAAANAVSSSTDTHPISPVAQEEKDRLAKLLANRSDVKDLQDKNILKSTPGVSPALAAKQAELAKAQLEDKLEGRLNRRPEREELEQKGILKDQKVSPALQAAKSELERSQLEDKLEKEIASRPGIDSVPKKILGEGA